MASTKDVLDNHLKSFSKGDLEGILSDYTPEAVMFTPDGKYILAGNFMTEDFSILKVDGTNVTDTGKRFKVPGHPASARMGH